MIKSKMSTKQRIHLELLHERKKAKFKARLDNALNYDLDFYRFKNGRINISKMSRCAGISRAILASELWKKGLI
ncbi:MAG: hypothetical protein MR902_07645 [Campylobacter sp.]|nr:hypothetical protein [Campylobacter sp.]